MKARFTRLFTEDGTRVRKHLAIDELNRMLACGLICWHEKDGKVIGVRLVPPAQQSPEYDSEPSYGGGIIRMSEIEANASGAKRLKGVNRYGGNDSMIVGNFVDHAMSKIEAWPLVGDDKAVRVSNGVFCRIR